ncbi:MAG: electron transfer flavoprotein subunit beta/FixA family protein [Nitrospirota bacterium]
MNIAVCVKQVPATDSRIKHASQGNEIDHNDLSYVVNPYDEFGVEEALRLKAQIPGTVVTVITIGPEKASEVLKTCLAIGADRAIHLKNPELAGGDAYATGLVLSAALKLGNYDIVFFGKHAIDSDSSAVPIHTAEFMGLPHVSVITKLVVFPEEKRAIATRQIEGASEVIETPLPAIFSCHKELNEPRYATLAGIMKAKQKTLTVMTLQELGLSEDQVGVKGSKLIIECLELPPPRKAGTILTGATHVAVSDLIRLLHEEAKIL